MATKEWHIGALLLAPVILAGCGTASEETHIPWQWPWEDTITTTATVRTVYEVDVTDRDEFGRVDTKQLRCTEPSPDVATAVSKSFGLGVGVDAKVPESPIEGQVTASIANSRAQAIAQLGERLATIQLLRDGLFRACEAYANGAITPTTYTLIVSRIDDIMVTLLSTEIAGGAFGRELAALGGNANSSAAAIQAAMATAEQVAEAENDVASAEATVVTQRQELARLEQLRGTDGAPADLENQITTQEGNVTAAENDLNAKQAALEQANQVAQFTRATAGASANFRAGGGLDRAPSVEIAEQIATIQQNYMRDANFDAIMAACVTELSQTKVDISKEQKTDTDRKSNNDEYFKENDEYAKTILAQQCETIVPQVPVLLAKFVALREKELQPDVIEARANAEAAQIAARSATARLELGITIIEYCKTKDASKQDECIESQSKLFGLIS